MAWVRAFVLLALGPACSSGGAPGPGGARSSGEPPPPWVAANRPEGDRACGVGVAGRTYHKNSDIAKELAKERSVLNLAGVFETVVLDAQIMQEKLTGRDVQFERAVEVGEDVVAKATASAETEYWFDEFGDGPLGAKEYTYARSCVSVTMASEQLGVDERALVEQIEEESESKVPTWIHRVGSQKGARLCAVGYSDPTYFPEDSFRYVVDDIRGQLVGKAQTMVLQAFEATSACRSSSACEDFLTDTVAATSEAISKNVVVTHLWYDPAGIGPHKTKRSSYGWGCVYPIKAVTLATPTVQEKHPEIDVEKVKEAQKKMFEELEQMEEKHGADLLGHATP